MGSKHHVLIATVSIAFMLCFGCGPTLPGLDWEAVSDDALGISVEMPKPIDKGELGGATSGSTYTSYDRTNDVMYITQVDIRTPRWSEAQVQERLKELKTGRESRSSLYENNLFVNDTTIDGVSGVDYFLHGKAGATRKRIFVATDREIRTSVMTEGEHEKLSTADVQRFLGSLSIRAMK